MNPRYESWGGPWTILNTLWPTAQLELFSRNREMFIDLSMTFAALKLKRGCRR